MVLYKSDFVKMIDTVLSYLNLHNKKKCYIIMVFLVTNASPNKKSLRLSYKYK